MNDLVWFFEGEKQILMFSWPRFSSITDGTPLKFNMDGIHCWPTRIPIWFEFHEVWSANKERADGSGCSYSQSLPTSIQKTSIDQYHFNVCVYRRKNIEEENRRTSNGAFSNFLIPTWFPKLKSTITAKLLSMNNWRFTLDQCRAVDVVHLDFANAFDMLAHIFKLGIVCVHPRIILWVTFCIFNWEVLPNYKFFAFHLEISH